MINKVFRIVLWHSRLVLGFVGGGISLLLLLAALWQFWFIPRMESYRPSIVAQLAEVSGLPLVIEGIQGGWDGIKPTLSFQNVRILDPSHQPVLHFSKLEGALAWWRLVVGQLHFTRIALYDPNIHLLRRPDGHWQIEGMMPESSQRGREKQLGNWLLDQGGLSITNGAVSLRDEQSGAPPITVRHIDCSSTRLLGRHSFTFKLSLSTQELGSGVEGRGRWVGRSLEQIDQWSGLARLQFTQVDFAQLMPWIQSLFPEKVGLPSAAQGKGNLALALSFKNKKIQRLDADLNLQKMDLSLLGRRWVLPIFNANITWRADQNTETLEMNARQISGASGDLFKGGYAQYHTTPSGSNLLIRELQLNNVSEYINGLPEQLAVPLEGGKFFGKLSALRYAWTGPFKQPKTYDGDIALEAVTLQLPKILPQLGPFNLKGHFSTQGGDIRLTGNPLNLHFPTQFVDLLHFETAQVVTNWLRKGSEWHFNFDKIALRNPEMALEVGGRYIWPGTGLGHLRLEGRIDRLSAKRAYAYLPRAIGDETLAWLRRALRDGQASDGQITVNGPLDQFPFHAKRDPCTTGYSGSIPIVFQDTGKASAPMSSGAPDGNRAIGEIGEQRSQADHAVQNRILKDDGYNQGVRSKKTGGYTRINEDSEHRAIQSGSTRASCAEVSKKDGLFRITAKAKGVALDYANDWPMLRDVQGNMKFEGRSMQISTASAQLVGVQLKDIGVQIADMGNNPLLEVTGQGSGETADFLEFISSSPVRQFTTGFLDSLKAQGSGQIDLKLAIPIHAVNRNTLTGRYRFEKNRLDFGHAIPVLSQASGQVSFTEKSIQIDEAHAHMLGGQIQFSGKNDRAGRLALDLKGTVQLAEAAKRYPIPLISVLSGSVGVQGEVHIGSGTYDLSLHSNLAEMGVDLPLPLGKRVGHGLPSQLQVSGQPSKTSVEFGYGNLLQGKLIWREKSSPIGGITLGGTIPVVSEHAIVIKGGWPEVDLSSWMEFLGKTEGGPWISDADLSFGSMKIMNRLFSDVKIEASAQPHSRWKVEFSSKEAAGQLDYCTKRLTAKLNHLHLPLPLIERKAEGNPEKNQAVQVIDSSKLSKLPALDLRIDDLRYEDKKFGKLTIKGSQQKEFWRIDSMQLFHSDTHFSFTGQWNNRTKPERTQGHFTLESGSLGSLLGLLGYHDAIKGAPGSLSGGIGWENNPFTPELASLEGQIKLDVKAGQFLKIDPGVGRFLSVLSLQALSRRVRLDFNDLFSKGFGFNSISAYGTMRHGIMHTENLLVNGSSAKVRFIGDMNFAKGTQNLRVRVLPMLSEGVAVVTGVVNPIAGLAALLLQKVFKDPLGQLIAYEYEITGSMADPQVKKVSQDLPEYLSKTN